MAKANYNAWQKIRVAVLDALIDEVFILRTALAEIAADNADTPCANRARALFAIDQLRDLGAIRVMEAAPMAEEDLLTLNLSSQGMRAIADVYSGAFDSHLPRRSV